MSCRTSLVISIIVISLMISGCSVGGTDSESPSPPLTTPSSTETASPEASEIPKVTLLAEFKELALAKAPAVEIFGSLRKTIGEVTPAEADELIRTMEGYYKANIADVEDQFAAEKVQLALSTATWPFTEDQIPEIEDESVRSIVERALTGGYKLEITEGYIFPIVDYSKLLSFGERLTTPMRTYLNLMTMESDEKTASDGGLVISLDELSRRTLAAESYVITFPDTMERNKVEDRYIQYLNNYLLGMDNTPIFDYETFLVIPEVRKHYEQMVTSHSGTVTGQLTKQMLTILDKSSGAVFLKGEEGEQLDIPAMKTFRDQLETTARSKLPQVKNN